MNFLYTPAPGAALAWLFYLRGPSFGPSVWISCHFILIHNLVTYVIVALRGIVVLALILIQMAARRNIDGVARSCWVLDWRSCWVPWSCLRVTRRQTILSTSIRLYLTLKNGSCRWCRATQGDELSILVAFYFLISVSGFDVNYRLFANNISLFLRNILRQTHLLLLIDPKVLTLIDLRRVASKALVVAHMVSYCWPLDFMQLLNPIIRSFLGSFRHHKGVGVEGTQYLILLFQLHVSVALSHLHGSLILGLVLRLYSLSHCYWWALTN